MSPKVKKNFDRLLKKKEKVFSSSFDCEKNIEYDWDPFKNDVFSLGLSILQLVNQF